MQNFWFEPLLRLLAISVTGLAVGALFGAAAGWFAVAAALLVLIVVQLMYLRGLQRWLDNPSAEAMPEGWGAWRSVFSELYRSRRREEAVRAELNRALDRFRQATRALPDGVVLLDASLHIEWCNPTAEEHFAIDFERDQRLLFTHIARHPELAGYFQRDSSATSITIRPLHNRSLLLSLQLIPFGESNRLLLSRDITAMERAERIRRDFVANVSHEMRTPLTVLTGFLELLDDGVTPEPETAKRQIGLMREQTARMTRLVEDLLTLSRLEADTAIAPDTVVDVPAMLDVLEEDAQALSGGAHRFEWHVDPELAVTGSERDLRSVFTNLVSNAIRYTPVGGSVAISWRAVDDEAVFAVTDTGIGVAPEHIWRLTERFYRVDTGRSRETGGTGLGLSIVKHVLMRHQGRLAIDSEPGRGSVFSAIFPGRRLRRLDVEATEVA